MTPVDESCPSDLLGANLREEREESFSEKAHSFAKNYFSHFYCPNPVTGNWQFWIIPQSIEINLGKFSFIVAKYLKGWGELSHKDKELCESIVSKLATQSNRTLPFQVTILQNKILSAWCSAGGYIGIHGHLLDKMEYYLAHREELGLTKYVHPHTGETISYKDLTKSDLIAAILGHEMTHADARHQGYMFERGIFLRLIRDRRELEFEADKYGLQLAAKSGFRPEAALFFLEVAKIELEKQLSSMPTSVKECLINSRTHPTCTKRQIALFETVKALMKS
ncbi:M48 family metallopeptidase [Candidatus Neptunichlamydia sp. REUL1]|uniref:M48 family metallopeptidase n=1 Tax=Candidatus Neptunichlamydia sp. REUL1 TaxID=3064277 RepID=UPI00292F302D|nr:M48 family metallopeptidase [Candidatus Neptunochlamydia sp. REUL1]